MDKAAFLNGGFLGRIATCAVAASPPRDRRRFTELNPDEMANADIKQAVTTQAPARTKLQLVKTIARHLRSVLRQPERVRKYFEHGPVRYAA